MRMVEALGVIDRGEEGGGGDGTDAGDGAEARDARILDGEVLDPLVAIRELPVEGGHEGQQRGDHREHAAWQGQILNAADKVLRAAGRYAVAMLAEQSPDERDVACARPDNGVPDHQAAAHMSLGVGEPMGRQASAKAPASRRSVLTLRVRVAYMGAKFGSATMTSWPRASRQRATHSLSVEASITMRARGRLSSTAAKRSGSVRMRCSMTSPPSAKM